MRTLLPLVAIASWVCVTPYSSGQVLVFTDESAFAAALGGAPQSFLDFNSAPLGNLVGNEFAGQGFLFSSPIALPDGQMEITGPDIAWPSRYLNIGGRPFVGGDSNHDDLSVQLVGDWNALGFQIVDGPLPFGAESITFFGDNNTVLYDHVAGDGAVAFIGLISAAPIRSVFIDETANDGDDVGYDNFRIAAVPEPATLLLVGTALASVGLWRRYRSGENHYFTGSYS